MEGGHFRNLSSGARGCAGPGAGRGRGEDHLVAGAHLAAGLHHAFGVKKWRRKMRRPFRSIVTFDGGFGAFLRHSRLWRFDGTLTGPYSSCTWAWSGGNVAQWRKKSCAASTTPLFPLLFERIFETIFAPFLPYSRPCRPCGAASQLLSHAPDICASPQ